MTRLWLFLIGALAVMLFAGTILVIIPKGQLSTLRPPPGLSPYTAAQRLGRQVYIANGCVYCHSQQVRDAAITNDAARGWGRPSVPEDFLHDYPHLLGTMRTGPDLINVGSRLPSRTWHLTHLYQPRALVPWSIMPAFPFLFEIKNRAAPGDEVVDLPPAWAPPGQVVVATPEARTLVDYLLSLDRSYPAPTQPPTHDQ